MDSGLQGPPNPNEQNVPHGALRGFLDAGLPETYANSLWKLLAVFNSRTSPQKGKPHMKANPFKRKNLATANSMRKPVKPTKQPPHTVERASQDAGDTLRTVSPRPSTSVAGDRTQRADAPKPKRGIRKDLDSYGRDASRDPWAVLRVLGEEREKVARAEILKKHGSKK